MSENFLSSAMKHVSQENHVIDWDNAKIIDKDSQKQTRWIREAIWIQQKQGDHVINRDDGTYSLNHVYDQLLEHRQQPSGNTSKSDAAAGVSSQN